ncbi:MFS transporter [Thermococci archaeon]|uniref:MFS transporter n=1 Tax=Palaeococcus sp. (in: euryarchaeotes) TaxID=2820298 RepID=UPI000F145145|nr:MFS transporter [Palaeococcus sp. (in: euryarchaeotes)]MCD6558360.1 MFS transporter [Palaeococcus sp. (in: euryarchaeotes)]RLF74713.1 MAG: MFS transporter [Thermococci archaeon]RLF90823.1 MAG: MFS transporter [Thermococci archaeon]
MERWKAVILDTLVMTAGFGTLSMMGVAKPDIISHFGISAEAYDLQHIAYVFGLFVAFLLGHTKLYEGSFKRSVAIALSFAAIPQALIPYMPNWYGVVFLRFIQGFVVSLVPLFSTQIANFFVAERPFAKGIILSGIFWGGVFGSMSAKYAVQALGWKGAFLMTTLIMYAVLLLWWLIVSDFEIIHKEEGTAKVSVWKFKFTWLLGFTFFPALWVIFTIIGFSASLGYQMGWGKDQVATLSTSLNISKALWSIGMGYVGYLLSRKNPSARGLFKAIVQVMIASYAIAFIGLLIYSKAILAGNYTLTLASVVLIGALQGTGPAFWTSAPATYPKSIYPRASFALGLISNSANTVAPSITEILARQSDALALGELALMPLIGILTLLAVSRMKMPVEELGHEA